MTHSDTRVRELIYELVEASPVAPRLSEIVDPVPEQRPRRNRAALLGALAILVLGAVVLAYVNWGTDSGTLTSRVRIDASRPLPRAPAYTDLSKPPPMRIIAGKRSVEIATILGCWSSALTDPARPSTGVCSEDVVDPSRFQLKAQPGERVVLQLPIAADLSASTVLAPTPPTTGAPFGGRITNAEPVPLRRDGPRRWSFMFRGASDPVALLIDLHADTSVDGVRVSGDAHYSLTLISGP
jgi:hypothetical protein